MCASSVPFLLGMLVRDADNQFEKSIPIFILTATKTDEKEKQRAGQGPEKTMQFLLSPHLDKRRDCFPDLRGHLLSRLEAGYYPCLFST